MAQRTTLFQPVQGLLPRHIFEKIVAVERGNHKVHFVDCWSHFLCLLFALLTPRNRLRDVETAIIPRQTFLKQFGLRSGRRGEKNDPHRLRYLEVLDSKTNKGCAFLTHQLTWADTTLCRLDRARWQIETFFKWIQQNPKIKTFYGRSFNAVCRQFFTALCLYLLLAFLKFLRKRSWALRTIQRLLASHLFEPADLETVLRGQHQFQT